MAQKRTEFAAALQSVANERGLEPSVVLDTIKQAIIAAYRRDARERGEEWDEEEVENLEVEISPDTGEAQIFMEEDGERKNVTPPGFGRIAAQTAKQVILQKIREAEKDTVLSAYEQRVGSLVSGTILRFDGSDVRVDLGRTEGIMPQQERIPNEKLNLNERLSFYLSEIQERERGREIILSRADPRIVEKLFAREVPEIASGAVEVKAVARTAGVRTKIAVSSSHGGVDPVGSCVGQKGVRVQAVIGELNNEKIDVIPWTDDVSQLIAFSLSPAADVSVKLKKEEKEAIVTVPEDQLSLAIGAEGQNVRLASKLSGWKIEIKGKKVVKEKPSDAEAMEGKEDKSKDKKVELKKQKKSEPEQEDKKKAA